MELIAAQAMALNLMDEHGLIEKGWLFEFYNAKTRNGQCRYDLKRIKLSRYFVESATPEMVRLTILHEIAHALVGKYVKSHGPEWKAKAISIGHTGERTSYSPYAEAQAAAKLATLEASVAEKGGEAPTVGVGSVIVYQGLEYTIFKKATKYWHARNVEALRRLDIPFELAHLYVKS